MEEQQEELVIAIPLFHQFTALDAVGPYEPLHMLPNAVVHFVSEAGAGEVVQADNGMLRLQVTASFQEVPHPHIILVPGGPGTFAALQDEALLRWIREAHTTSLYTTSVCTGSIILGAAGLLNGVKATTYWRFYDALSKFGAIPIEERVMQQGKIITAAGVSSGIDMAISLIALLRGEEMAKMVQLLIEYDPQPPYDVGTPSKAGEALVARTRDLAKHFRSQVSPNDQAHPPRPLFFPSNNL